MKSRRDEFDQHWQPRLWIRVGLLILIGAYLIAFIVGNDEDASVNFVLWEARTSLIWVILLSLLAGLIGGVLLSQLHRRRQGPQQRRERRDAVGDLRGRREAEREPRCISARTRSASAEADADRAETPEGDASRPDSAG